MIQGLLFLDEFVQIITHQPSPARFTSFSDSVMLKCIAAVDIREVQWFKNGMAVVTSEYIKIEVTGKETTLSLPRFSVFHLGVYHVVVDGVGSTPAKVTAEVKPVFLSKWVH